MKDYLEKIIKIYNDSIVDRPTKMKNGSIQLMKRFEDETVIKKIYDLTKENFINISKEFPEVVIKFKYGQAYNLANSPWIQFYYLEKNAKATKGNYCGISINVDDNTISLWIGFGKTGLRKKEINDSKEKLISLYKRTFGDSLERGFEYKTVFLEPVIISKTYDIKDIIENELEEDIKYLLGLYVNVENINSTVSHNLLIDDNLVEDNMLYDKSESIQGLNIIYRGYPGSGKSYEVEKKYLTDKKGNMIDERRYERVVFYPEYTNADFVGTIRPIVRQHQTTYEFFPGPFTTILKRSIENPNTNFYLIIEEINRGKAESIFGDILLLLDRNKDGRSVYSITNSCIAEYVYKNENKKIFIPSNLSIIASMNVSDENVQTLDTAFERRWDDVWILGEKGIYDDKYIKGMNEVKWGKFREVINKCITSQQGILHNEDKQLGAYFINDNLVSDVVSNLKNDREKFLHKVVLYLYNKVCKYDKTLIFDEKIDSISTLIEVFLTNDYLTVFNDKIRDEL